MQTIITLSPDTGHELKHFCDDNLVESFKSTIGDVVNTYETTQEELAELNAIISRPVPIKFNWSKWDMYNSKRG